MTTRRPHPEAQTVQSPERRRSSTSLSLTTTPSRSLIPARASRQTASMAQRRVVDTPSLTTYNTNEDEMDELEEMDVAPPRSHSSVRRYHPLPMTEPTLTTHPSVTAAAVPRRKRHWLTTLGLSMTVVLLGWLLTWLAIGWIGTRLDDLHYGFPRTFQADAVVGHNDSVAHPSHFLAQNLHGHIQVLEEEGDDLTKAHLYPIATLEGQDETPVTLSFVQIGGKECMVVHFGALAVLLVNTGSSFQAQGTSHP